MHESESEVAQSCLTLSDHMDCSLPGSSIHGIFQARILEWGAIAFSEEEIRSAYIHMFLPIHPVYAFGFAACAAAKSRQSCPTLCDSIDGSPPGSPVPGILQARTLEWVAISFSSA